MSTPARSRSTNGHEHAAIAPLVLNAATGRPLRILCLGAHADDIEIGCGGTILKLLATYPDVEVRWVVFASTPERAREARRSASRFLGSAHGSTVVVKRFRDSFFPYIGADIKEAFEELKRQMAPDVIFTHYRDDRHQDHRVISDLTWNSFRNHLILEYEIPKYDGDLGAPNIFVPIAEELADEKVRLLLEHFPSQADKLWFDEELFRSVMRLRGMEATTHYAEAFTCRKLRLEA